MTLTDWLNSTKAICEKATPAPWKIWAMSVLHDPVGDSNMDTAIPVCDTKMLDEHGKPRTFDAMFISQARTALPLALQVIEKLSLALAEISDYEKHLDGITAYSMQKFAKEKLADIDALLAGEGA